MKRKLQRPTTKRPRKVQNAAAIPFERSEEPPSRVFELSSSVCIHSLPQCQVDFFANIAQKAVQVADVLKFPMEMYGRRMLVRSLTQLEAASNPDCYSFTSPLRSTIPAFPPWYLADTDLDRGLNLVRSKLNEILVALRMEAVCHSHTWSKGLVAVSLANDGAVPAESQEACIRLDDLLHDATVNVPVVTPTEWAEWLRAGSELIRDRLAALTVKPPVATNHPEEMEAETYTREEIAELCDRSVAYLRSNDLLGPPKYPSEGRGKPHRWLKDDPTVIALLRRFPLRNTKSPAKGRQKK